MENKKMEDKAAHPIINLLVVLIKEISKGASGDWTPVWRFLRAAF